jgi:hypothetical protein
MLENLDSIPIPKCKENQNCCVIQQFLFWCIPKRACLRSYLYTRFTAAWFTTARPWMQPKCPSTDEQISKMWHMHAMEYSALKWMGIAVYDAK